MKDDKNLSLVISTTRGTDTFDFPKTTKVEEAITVVRNHFELTGDGQFALVKKDSGEPLEPLDRPLVSFNLEDGDELVLTGGGVNV